MAGKTLEKFGVTYSSAFNNQVEYSFELNGEDSTSTIYQLNNHSALGYFVSQVVSQSTKMFSLVYFDRSKPKERLERCAIPIAFEKSYHPWQISEVTPNKYVVALRQERIDFSDESEYREYCYVLLDVSTAGKPECAKKIEVGSSVLDFLLIEGFNFRKYGSLLLAWSSADIEQDFYWITVH